MKNVFVFYVVAVTGLGFKGDIVNVTRRLARNHMFPASVAEYLTEENLKKYEHIRMVVYYAIYEYLYINNHLYLYFYYFYCLSVEANTKQAFYRATLCAARYLL